MRLIKWLGLSKERVTACFAFIRSPKYPKAQLLPRPTYRLLRLPNQEVSTGWLLRRTNGKNVFRIASGRKIISDPKQLCDAPNHLSEGFSVSLWGHFKLRHNGWKPANKEARLKTFPLWTPPNIVEPPTADQMQYMPRDTWDVVGFDIARIDGHPFNLPEFGLIHASVVHVPNCWNYWHYEVRFQDKDGHWLHLLNEYNPVPYKNKRLTRLQNELLTAFIQAGLAVSITPAQKPSPLRSTVYDTMPSFWTRLFNR